MATKINIANPDDKGFWKNTYLMAFGAYSATYVLAYANSLDDAFDECVDWIVDNAPGLLADKEVADEYKRLLAKAKEAGEDIEDESVIQRCQEEAEIDTCTGGNASNYLHSHECHLIFNNPGRETLIEYGRRLAGY